MKFVFASDSFKGSLTSEEIAKILSEQGKKYFNGPFACVKVCE
jgi:glycerate kinase